MLVQQIKRPQAGIFGQVEVALLTTPQHQPPPPPPVWLGGAVEIRLADFGPAAVHTHPPWRVLQSLSQRPVRGAAALHEPQMGHWHRVRALAKRLPVHLYGGKGTGACRNTGVRPIFFSNTRPPTFSPGLG